MKPSRSAGQADLKVGLYEAGSCGFRLQAEVARGAGSSG